MWLLPTLNRIEKLRAFLMSAKAAGTVTPGLVLIDKEDYSINRRDYDDLEAAYMPDGWAFYITDAVSMGDKCREAFGAGMVVGCDWVGILNDDHYVVTPNWDKLLIAKLDGKNFVSANDRWVAPTKATTATVWSKPLLDILGWPIYPPGLQHLFIDDLWEHLGRQTGCWRVAMNVVVEHRHVIKDPKIEDDTHRKVYNQKSWDMDKAIFDNFMKHDFNLVVQKIKDFQNYLPQQSYNPSPSRDGKNAI